ncbi:MAG TPA: hypothetical protein VES20_00340, partial [Bryobacteraceae bacterium]|nr:hypothetical protein [Bryobacteraceae bacterium]
MPLLFRFSLLALIATGLSANTPEELDNVNSRYRVESVQLNEALKRRKLSSGLQSDLDGVVGRNFDPHAV